MAQSSRAEASDAATAFDIAKVEAPIAVCAAAGLIVSATAPALRLLRRTMGVEQVPLYVPADLWRLLERTPRGEPVEWRPLAASHEVLGCTRYAAASGTYVLLMREVSARRLALSERIDRQRAEQIGWLVGSVARDLRSSVASVAYSADFLNGSGSGVNPGVLRETVGDIAKASRDLQLTLDALLDFARLGPAVCVPVQVREVLGRAVGSLRAHYRDGAHRLRVDVAPRAEKVLVNPLVLEQIFVQLLLNAVEASAVPRCVIVTAFPGKRTGNAAGDGHQPDVCVRVWDDGPGIPAEHRQLIFEPFFTTKQGSPGLGLSLARRAAESLGGALELTDDDTGTCFTLFLPRDEGT